MKYKNKKLFDCQDMPENLMKTFFDEQSKGNDVIVSRYVHDEMYDIKEKYVKIKDGEILYRDEADPNLVIIRGNDPVSDWLLDNGAELHEEVLIKHWW